MRKTLVPLLVAASVAMAAPARAQSVPVVDRPLVTPEATGEVGLQFSLGLDQGSAGKRVGFRNEWAGDRYSGISFKYGAMKSLEVGAAVQLGWRDASQPASTPNVTDFLVTGDGFKFHGAYVWVKYEFAPFIAGEFGLRVPGEQFNSNRVLLEIGLPFRWIFSPGLFAAHVRPDLILGFAKQDKNMAGDQPVQASLLVDYGVTLNLMDFFLDISSAVQWRMNATPNWSTYICSTAACTAGKPDTVSGVKVVVPMVFKVGYTILPVWDLWVNFVLDDMHSPDGGAAHRGMTLGSDIRF